MHNPAPLQILFVVNPVSGGKKKHDWEAAIRAYFQDRPDSVQFYLLTGKEDKQSVRHHIERMHPDRVVAVGGDGTVKMLAELLMDTDIPLGIVPAGSANGMARELNIPDALEAALDIVTGGEKRKLDLIQINEKEICLHLSDIGLNALLVKYFENSGSRGMWGYAKAVVRVLLQRQSVHATIRTDEGEIKRHVYMVVIANAKTYGTGAIINPDGSPDDGHFEVVVIQQLKLAELFKMLVSHQPFDPSCIEVFHTKQLELTTQHKAYFQVDGEYLGRTNRVVARILPQAVHVMLPGNR